MDLALADWLNLVFRWLHLVAGIAWIGTSFYFIFLDLSLRKRRALPPGVGGESWNVHGGGFYLMQKYTVAPAEMPEELHWFKWEAYTTFLSGFALMAVIYYWSADTFLIDPDVADLSRGEAIMISIGFLGGGWIVYSLLCYTPFLARRPILLSAAVFAFILIFTVALTDLFSPRAAFVHVGAIIGTIMVANVYFIIIPNQRVVVADLIAGRTPEAWLGDEAKQRSTHNNYLTLPVLVMMLVAHYPMLYSTAHPWLVVALVIIVGGVIRDFFNRMHAGQSGRALQWQWPASAVFMLILIGFVSYRPDAVIADGDVPDEGEVFAIVQTHCVACHAVKTTHPDFKKAQKGVMFDTLADIRKHGDGILKQSVMSRAMPPGNQTRMSAEERELLGLWIRAGMP